MSDERLARLETQIENIQRFLERIDGKFIRIYQRLDDLMTQGHERRLKHLEDVRVPAIEERLDGLWGKITVMVTATTSAIVGLAEFIWGKR